MRGAIRHLLIFAGILVGLTIHSSVVWAANTYYIDCAGGSDSDNGTSTSAPWLHHPYMQGFRGKYSHKSGDQFIFKGGVTCPNSYFPLVPVGGGTSGAPDYYGVSQSWYTGGAWTRPIFDSQGQAVSGPNVEINLTTNSPSWITFDNIEFRGHYWSGSYGWNQNVTILGTSSITGIVIQNCYFHGWTHAPYNNGQTPDSYTVIGGATYGYFASNMVTNSTFDDSDGDGVSGEAIYYWTNISQNIVHDMSNGFVGASVVVNGNLLYNIHNSYDPTDHMNLIEVWTPLNYTQAQYIYNNVMHDSDSGVYPLPIGTGGVLTGAASQYVFNNVMWNIAWGEPLVLDPSCEGNVNCQPSQWSEYIWNNTFVANGTMYCARVVNRGNGNVGTVYFQNNHCISDNTEFATFDQGEGINKLRSSNNILMTHANATSQGYTVQNGFQPTGESDSTVKAATNLTADCQNQLSALCKALLNVPRPSGGAWDVGSYEYTGSPSAPQKLTATPVKPNHSVTR